MYCCRIKTQPYPLQLCKAEGATFPEEQELRAKVRSILERHTVAPSPVHGDLWAGNFGWTKDGEPVIYDPAFYYGDRYFVYVL